MWEQEEENVSAAEDEITSDKFEGMGALIVDEPTELASSDLYQLNKSIAVTEEQSDEIDGEFEDSLTEICGEKSFPFFR